MKETATSDLPPLHSFETEGMNTVFTIRIHHHQASTARTIAGNCFCLLEELEAQLSRYRPDSDVSRINLLKSGESILLSDVTYRCLQRSLEATAMTAGLFDVTLGAQTRRAAEPFLEVRGTLALSPERAEIFCEKGGRELDFGGIGKGFALDEMAGALQDLGVESALLSCGASTHLAIGSHDWPLELRGDQERKKVSVSGASLSASGTGEQGEHVVHPDTGIPPEYSYRRVWVIAKSAALADALSTACLIMDREMLASFAKSAEDQAVLIHFEDFASGAIEAVCL